MNEILLIALALATSALTAITGIGGGIIENGKLVTGSHRIAGEVGHITIQIDGDIVARRDHLARRFSERALVDVVQRRGPEAPYHGDRNCQHDSGTTGKEFLKALDQIDGHVG